MSQILANANIFANQNIICFEECSGIVLGSIAERIGGYGRVFNVHWGRNPLIGISRFFNFNETEKSSMAHIRLDDLFQILFPVQTEVLNEDVSRFSQEMQSEVLAKREEKFQKRTEIGNNVRKYFNEGVNSLIIAVRAEPPLPLLEALYPFLLSSGLFCIYSQYIQSLVSCFQTLRDTNSAVNIRLTESWLREYQVLPMRTHPELNMSGGGGYLLTGNKLKCDFGTGKLQELLASRQVSSPKLSSPPAKKPKIQ